MESSSEREPADNPRLARTLLAVSRLASDSLVNHTELPPGQQLNPEPSECVELGGNSDGAKSISPGAECFQCGERVDARIIGFPLIRCGLPLRSNSAASQ